MTETERQLLEDIEDQAQRTNDLLESVLTELRNIGAELRSRRP